MSFIAARGGDIISTEPTFSLQQEEEVKRQGLRLFRENAPRRGGMEGERLKSVGDRFVGADQRGTSTGPAVDRADRRPSHSSIRHGEVVHNRQRNGPAKSCDEEQRMEARVVRASSPVRSRTRKVRPSSTTAALLYWFVGLAENQNLGGAPIPGDRNRGHYRSAQLAGESDRARQSQHRTDDNTTGRCGTAPSRFTRLHRAAAFFTDSRTQPCEDGMA